MFAVGVELLTGRYGATRHNDRAAPEWPPHPQRLFSALVATWATSELPDDTEARSLEWLEGLGAPDIACSEAWPRAVVTSYVPVNDAAVAREPVTLYTRQDEALSTLIAAQVYGDTTAVTKAETALERVAAQTRVESASAVAVRPRESPATAADGLRVLPHERGRQGRVYPVVVPDDPLITYSWPAVTAPAEMARALDGLLGRVHRLGHSSTFVSCRVVTDGGQRALVPSPAGGELLRIPGPGLLTELRRAFVASREGTEPHVLPTRYATYGRPQASHAVRRSVLAGAWIVLVDRGGDGRRLPLRRAAELAGAIRAALMSHAIDPPPELITGHVRTVGHERLGRDAAPDTAPLDRPHLAVLPLGFVGSSRADGAISGVALALPVDTSEDDHVQLGEALQRWGAARSGGELLVGLGGGRARPLVQHSDDDELPVTLRRSTWCVPSTLWNSATPIALDRHPGNLRDTNAARRAKSVAAAIDSIVEACGHMGLPAPVEVDVGRDPFLAGVPSASSFPPFRSGRGPARAMVHARVRFAEPVGGPLVLGAGRYRGLGLFKPSMPREGAGLLR